MNDPEWRDKSQEDPVKILFLTDRLNVGPVICSFDLFCVSGSAAGT